MHLYIIRHADPNYKEDTITDLGRQEAAALAEWLREVPLNRIYSSPLGRAMATAEITCVAKGMDMTILPWTAEHMDYLDSSKLTPNSVCNYKFSVPKGVFDFEDFMSTDRILTIEEMQNASDDFLKSLGYVREGLFYKVQQRNEEHIAVFCHGGFGAAWIAHLLGLPPGLWGWPTILLDTCSVTTFWFPDSEHSYVRPVLQCLGETHQLRSEGHL